MFTLCHGVFHISSLFLSLSIPNLVCSHCCYHWLFVFNFFSFILLWFHQAMKSLQHSHFVLCLYLTWLSFALLRRELLYTLNNCMKSWERVLDEDNHWTSIRLYTVHFCVCTVKIWREWMKKKIAPVFIQFSIGGDIGHGFVTVTNNISLNHTHSHPHISFLGNFVCSFQFHSKDNWKEDTKNSRKNGINEFHCVKL